MLPTALRLSLERDLLSATGQSIQDSIGVDWTGRGITSRLRVRLLKVHVQGSRERAGWQHVAAAGTRAWHGGIQALQTGAFITKNVRSDIK